MNNRERVSSATVRVLVEMAMVGALLGLTLRIGQLLGAAAWKTLSVHAPSCEGVVLLVLMLLLAILVGHGYARGADGAFLRLYRSRRLDIACVAAAGAAAAYAGLDPQWGVVRFVTGQHAGPVTLALLAGIFPVLLITLVQGVVAQRRQDVPLPLGNFLSDEPVQDADDDLLSMRGEAERFAQSVLDHQGRDSIVFALDSPWGSGKTSFINVCEQVWRAAPDFLVYRFEPLRYEDRQAMVQKFTGGLVDFVQSRMFAPELASALARYAAATGKTAIKIGDWEVPWLSRFDVDATHTQLRQFLLASPFRILVVIDDLDRLDYSAVKDLLFAVRASFSLPRLSFLLCYDTANLAREGQESEDGRRVRGFLEKYVNVKTSLLVDADVLRRYVDTGVMRALENLAIDAHRLDQVKRAVKMLATFYEGNQVAGYMKLVGDLRQVKRLINTLILLGIDQADTREGDIDPGDLMRLVLLYSNFPDVFRAVYESEANGHAGPYAIYLDSGERGEEDVYRNHAGFEEALARAPVSAQFLLRELFACNVRIAEEYNPSDGDRIRHACYNGNAGVPERTLERYLRLIVRVAKPQGRTGYRLSVNDRDRIREGAPLSTVLQDGAYAPAQGEQALDTLFNLLVNTAYRLKENQARPLVDYLVDRAPRHCMLENARLGLGLREHIPYRVLKLLDGAVWRGEQRDGVNNSPERIRIIAQLLLGVPLADEGILVRLSQERGPLGWNDALTVRLYCSADRGNTFMNTQRALIQHAVPGIEPGQKPEANAVLCLREASQLLFGRFHDAYIGPGKNFIAETLELPDEALLGDYVSYVKSRIDRGDVAEQEVRRALQAQRAAIASFCLYQLANRQVSSGVGCGYYDTAGTQDEHGIHQIMNSYLFEVCFANTPEGARSFVDYCLLSTARELIGSGDEEPLPRVEMLLRVLDADLLARFWRERRPGFIAAAFERSDRVIELPSASVAYARVWPRWVEALDALVESQGGLVELAGPAGTLPA